MRLPLLTPLFCPLTDALTSSTPSFHISPRSPPLCTHAARLVCCNREVDLGVFPNPARLAVPFCCFIPRRCHHATTSPTVHVCHVISCLSVARSVRFPKHLSRSTVNSAAAAVYCALEIKSRCDVLWSTKHGGDWWSRRPVFPPDRRPSPSVCWRCFSPHNRRCLPPHHPAPLHRCCTDLKISSIANRRKNTAYTRHLLVTL